MKITRKLAVSLLSILLLGGVTGCYSSRSGTTFSRDEALHGMQVYEGTIESVQAGRIEGTQTPIGAIAGGVLGGVAGSSVGGGSGKDIAVVAGALGGAALGALAEEGFTSKKAISVTVKYDDGRQEAIVQEDDMVLQPGQRVRVLVSSDGRKRVQPK